MGTNFYFMSKDKKLMRENFAVETEYGIHDVEYEIVDEPYLGYEVHLNKLSGGWRPLFQSHKNITTFKELEKFYLRNNSSLEIYDEYGRRYTWNQYRDKIYRHSQCRRKPFRWVYAVDPFFNDCEPRLHTVPCEEKDADIYMPFSHNEYMKKEHLARQRFHVYERAWCDAKYWEDPDYPFDWTEGEFC